jgi:hypothetical protein
MAPPFLFLNASRAGGAQVFRYDGATPTQIGNTFGTLETDISNYQGKNRVIQFQNELYAVQNLGVYKLQGDGLTWSNASMDGGLTFTSPFGGSGTMYRTGLYPIEINGESNLICVYVTNTSRLVVATLDAATNTWTDTGPVGPTFTPDSGSGRAGFFTEIVYQNKFFISSRTNGGTAQTWSYDPVLGTMTALAHPLPSAQISTMNICIHNGRLFMSYITNTGSGGRHNLAEFTGGQWVNIGQITPANDSPSTLTNTQMRGSLMSDGSNLYYVYLFNNTNKGFRIVEITDVDSLPGTNIQGTVFPSALLSSGDGGTGFASGTARLVHVPDTQTNPGSPDHYFYFANSAVGGTSMQLYQWKGNGMFMTAVGPAGGDVLHAIPTACSAGGERIFSDVSTDNDILITKRETVSGGIKVTFRAYSPSGTTSGTARFLIDLEGETPTSFANLTTPVTGGSATLSGNQILNVVADGTTDYTVVVSASANSFSNLDQVDLIPEFF